MTPRRTGEPTLTTWAVLVASFALSAATWVSVAQLAGFTQTLGPIHLDLGPLAPITVGPFRLAWLMPVAVDGYVVVSLVTWMAPVPERVAAFAKKNTYAAAAVGVAAQSAFHGFLIWTSTGVIWRTVLAGLAGLLPPAVAALSVHMRALTRRAAMAEVAPRAVPAQVAQPVPAAPPTDRPRVDPLHLDAALAAEPAPEAAGTPELTPEPVPVPVKPKPRRPWNDQQIRAALRDPAAVPRGADGKVSVEYVQQTFGRGQDKAIELLKLEGLHRARDGERVPEDGDEAVPATREEESVPA